MTDSALHIQGLSFALREVPILHEVTARIGCGQTWSIVGPNGAGKSTLLKCLVRIHRGWNGEVHLFGRPLQTYSQRALARRVAYVPQPGSGPPLPYAVHEFVRMGRYAYAGPLGRAHRDDEDAVAAAMARTGVTSLADRRLDTLSGGERQKVAIAAALAQQAEVLLLDEPSAFLDYRHQAEIAAIVHALNRDAGTTVVIVTHDVNAAVLMGGHTLALRNGRVAWSGPTAQLACEMRLNAIFDATFRLIDDPVTGARLVAPQGAE